MTTKTLHSAYTPSQRTAADLEQLFVVREPIADSIIKTVKASVLTANKHNNLLIGPRGIGKPILSLLSTIALQPMNPLAANLKSHGYQKTLTLPATMHCSRKSFRPYAKPITIILWMTNMKKCSI